MKSWAGLIKNLEGLKKDSYTHFPPSQILVVDHDPSILYRLVDDFPEVEFDLSSTFREGESKLRTKRYHGLITNVQFAVREGSSLLKVNQSEQWTTSCIVTAHFGEKTLAQRALKQGALDCILKPLSREQTIPAIRSALRLYHLRNHIAARKHSLRLFIEQQDQLCSHKSAQTNRAQLFDREDVSFEDAIKACDRTITVIEESLQLLSRAVVDAERDARSRALDRLHQMPKYIGSAA
jgi:FixJ family two-component response regulator